MRLEGIMQGLQDVLLKHRSQVDKHIATTDHVQSRERRIVGEVVSRKDTPFSNSLADLVALSPSIQRNKKPLQALRRDCLHGLHQVDARPGVLDGCRIDISRKELEGVHKRTLLQELKQADRQRVHFLAGGTSC